jgi:cytoskeletal protein RodZ
VKLSNEAQEEEFKDIGLQLQQAREAKSISIDEVAFHTRIRPAFIQALEEGRAEELPEAVFVQGFIRRYCDAIGIDSAAITSKFGDSFITVDNVVEDTNIEKKSSIYIPLVVPYILLLVAASFGLFYILNPRRGNESIAQKVSSTKTPKPTSLPNSKSSEIISSAAVANPTSSITPTVSSTISTTASPTPTPTNSQVEVGIELQGKSWVQVKVDGKTEFEGELPKGHKQTWTGTKEVVIRSGNAGAVLISANKKPPVPMGANDDVKQIVFTSEPITSEPITSEPIPSATTTPTP